MRMWNRSLWLATAATLAAVIAGCGDNGTASTQAGAEKGPTPNAKKKVVGFAQVGAESAWRTANTKSIQDEAAKRGYDLKFASAEQKPEKQVADVRTFISQKVDVILVEPIVETGWETVFKEAKDAEIPVVMGDRRANVPEEYYATFIGSDFIQEGRRAGAWLAARTKGECNIFQLEGTMGSAPQIDRKKGFEEIVGKNPGMKIIKSQTGEFTRAKGKEVMEAFLNSPEGKTCNVLFAHNDDMAMGAIQAIEAAGKKPGTDILIVSIDGIGDALKAIKDGKLNCSVECNPLLGPQLFDAIDKVMAGKASTLAKREPSKEGVFDAVGAKVPGVDVEITKVTDEVLAARKY